ncbi:ptzC [Candidatus Endolissoclinum faulkneri L5]|uniref:PtzC n=1 Tax=Candidatus Endolissoclinum faulkneri L5 TaxID=1401328 RepID=V9TTR4_9PROT|nr:SDR family NAD(P)-dependent oxidoreductase [Candidatus Endolissoclinum faulkneri]AHC73996.1 ptzC [Candidatus Endolissoclinum faulkneri L5]
MISYSNRRIELERAKHLNADGLIHLKQDLDRVDLERVLLEIISKVLGERIDPEKAVRSFADLGLGSLLSVRLIEEINKTYGLKLGVETVFAHPSPIRLATYVASMIDKPIKPTIVSSQDRASFNRSMAIVGLSGAFGPASSLSGFSDALMHCKSLVHPLSDQRRRLVRPLVEADNSTFVGGFLENIELFDAELFGLSPREASAIDPQQRLFLERAYLALENAGYPAARIAGKKVGVYVGASPSGYEQLITSDHGAGDAWGMTGNLTALLASRISYYLDLSGPALTVDTACSSSLVALDLAVQGIKNGDCDMALVGGVSLFLNPTALALMQRAGMHSKQGRCATFDASADGIVVAEAVVAAVIKPFEQSLIDGDRVDAVILSTAINQDGRSNGITAPNSAAQTDLICAALNRAGLDADAIDLIEAHGTGTPLGDPVEIAGLFGAFRERSESLPAIGLGSSKSVLGHASEAAGLVGVASIVAALKAEAIPPIFGFTNLNPKIDLSGKPLELTLAKKVWPRIEGHLRRAGVNSFGLAGTNVHAIIAEGPSVVSENASSRSLPLLLSAETPDLLSKRANSLLDWLKGKNVSLTDFAGTLALRRSHYSVRAGTIVASLDEVCEVLKELDQCNLSSTCTDPVVLDYLGGGENWIDSCNAIFGDKIISLDLPDQPLARESLWAFEVDAVQSTRLSLSMDDPKVGDHRVGNQSILHAAALLDIVLDQFGDKINEIAWLRPVIVGKEGAVLILSGGDKSGGLATLEGGETVFSFGASCSPDKINKRVDFSELLAIQAAAVTKIEGGVSEPAPGVWLGPSYRGFDRLSLAPNAAVGSVDLSNSSFPRLRALDAAIQSAVAVVATKDGDNARTLMPVRLHELSVLMPIPALPMHLLAYFNNDLSCGAESVVDVSVVSDDGAIAMQLNGLTLHAIDSATQSPIVQQKDPPVCLRRLVWKEYCTSSVGEVDLRPTLIIGNGDLLDRVSDWLIRSGTVVTREQVVSSLAITSWVAATKGLRRIVLYLPADYASNALDRGARLIRSMACALSALEEASLDVLILAPGAKDDPVRRGLIALAKVSLDREIDKVIVRAVDCDNDTAIEVLLTEPGSVSGEMVVLSNGKRFEQRLKKIIVPRKANSFGHRIVILGGFGRVGRVLANRIAERWKADIVLVGRKEIKKERAAYLETLLAKGIQVHGLSSDLTDSLAAEIALRTARDKLGGIDLVIQAVVDPVFGRLSAMPESDMLSGLRPKTAGGIAVKDALKKVGEGRLVVISSIGAFAAFPGAAGQAVYAAQCAFESGLADANTQVVHWGLWANQSWRPELLAQVRKDGLFPIPEDAAFDSFESALLMQCDTPLVAASLSASVWRALGDMDHLDSALGEPVDVIDQVSNLADSLPGDSLERHAVVDSIANRRLLRVMKKNALLGLPGTEENLTQAIIRFGTPSRLNKLANAVLNLLIDAGAAERRPNGYIRWCKTIFDSEDDGLEEFAASDDISKAVALLMADCIDALPKVLAGELLGTDVLFPNGSAAKVEPIYKHQPGLKSANILVAETVASLYNRSKYLSLLEIGAGTGATTEAIKLRLGNADERLSYCYTDLSVGFVRHGEKFHSAPNLTAAVLDIEQDPIEQGFIEQGFDIVVASNVLHATARLDDTLSHVWKLLRPGGILILNENVRLEAFATLTFGLLEGWWRSEDPQKRLAGGPLLDLARWRLALHQAGLDVIAELAPGNVPDHASQVVIISLKAGVESAGFVPPISSKSVTGVESAGFVPPISSNSLVDTVTNFSETGLRDTVRQIVAEALGRAPDSIDDSLPFADYGVDSIVSPQIAQSLAERFQVTLRSTDLFSYTTVDVLANHIKGLGPIIPDTESGDIVTSIETPILSTSLPSLIPASTKLDKSDKRIAIIGLAGRFPDAPNVNIFWRNLRDGHCAIRPIKRFSIPETFDGGCNTSTPIYARWAGLIDDFDQFDPLFFKITPAEALTMDPQQRLLLEEAWHAIEDAGLCSERIAGSRTGVFVGSSANSYVAPGTPAMQTIGGSMAILSARLAYLLDLRGPTFPIDTGCSSSLVALSLARDSLLTGQCDLAIVAGVGCNLLSEDILAYLSDAGMASPTGVCYAFDDRADGFVPGEGVGVLVLKRLADAESDNDRIRALILGAGINQDGRTSGITAPSAVSQTALERRVWEEASVSADSITLVEAHGTGTRLGDPIEIAALNDAFAPETSRRHFCAIGSVKTNIGHAMAAAGLAGLIKTVLALENRVIPRSLFFEKANRHIDFDSSPLIVARKTMPWSIDDVKGGRRRAAVSSFGFSGTNAHVVLEEAPEVAISEDNIPGPWIFVISAKTNEALNKIALALADYVEQANHRLGDIAYTLALRREHFRYRRVVIAAGCEELVKALRMGNNGRVLFKDTHDFSTSIPRILRDAEIDYLAGNTVDFAPCFPGSSWRLVSLPGYPFARESYWQPIRREVMQASSMVDPQLIVDGNTVTIILIVTNWRLDQHRVHGKPMLPAAAMVELIGLAIMAKNGSLPTCLADLVWHSPVKVEGSNLLLTFVMNGDKFRMNRGDVLVVEGSVDYGTYQSQVIDTTNLTAAQIDGSYLLSISKVRGIAYGPRFAILNQIHVGEEVVWASLSPDVQATSRTADIIDAGMQAAAGIGVGTEEGGGGSPAGLYVPHALGRIVWLTNEKSTPAQVLAKVLRRDISGALFDITIANEDGQSLVKMDKLVARRMEDNNNDLCLTTLYAPRWIAADERRSPMLDRIVEVGSKWLDNLEDLPTGMRLGVVVKLPTNEYGKLALAELSLVVRGLSALSSAPIVHLMAILDGDSEAPFVRAVAAALRAILVENVGWRIALVSGAVNTAQLPAFPDVTYVEDLRITLDNRLERRMLHDLGSITTISSSPLASDSIVVISGGLGGLGSELASVLSHAGLRPVLLSRRAGKAEVPVVIADVTDKDALDAALERIRSEFGAISAVLHLAGKQLDGIFSATTLTNIDEVFAAKVTGFIMLDEATRDDPIKLFAVFGSTAAEFGSFGQAVYGAANAAVASLATTRSGPGNTLCVAWPLWKSGGMTVPDDLVNMLKQEAGLEPLSTELGVNLLWSAAQSGEVTPLVLHGIGDVAAGLMRLSTSITPIALPAVRKLTPSIDDATTYIASILSEVAAIPLNRVDPELPFEQYGIDSMMITRLNLAMERDLGALPKTLFFEYRTPGEIASYLNHNKASELAAMFKPTRLSMPSHTITPPQTSKFTHAPTDTYLADREDSDVAIIGIAGIFPGAEDLEVFWEHLRSSADLIREIPADRWSLEGFYDPDRENISTSYSKWGGFIDGADMFDPLFFDMAPLEAEALDPQARKMLEVAWWALEDAGYTRSNLFSSDPNPSLRKGGVFVGLMHSDYQLFAAESRVRGELAITSSGYWNAANRISHFLNLHGPSVAIDTACSASLTAIYSALRALAAGDCTVAIAGGVNLSLHPMKYWVLSKAGFASTDGRCRSFGEGGNGYVPGEGAGAVLLKPLARAKMDGDRIHGVIRASAVNHGGRTSGFTVPNPVAQGQLISDAFNRAGITPSSISYVEAHGTGTALGDPIEITGLKRAFGNVVNCPIGSVKSNIGHLESAAGIAALAKVLLQMRHHTLAPSLHATKLNPDLGIEGSGFRVVTKNETWKAADGAPLRAGISSFGAGGANTHLIVDAPPFVSRKIIKHEALPFLLSARTINLLKVVAAQLAKFVEKSDTHLADIAFTLVEGREAMKQRAVVVAADRLTLIAGLCLIAEGKDLDNFGLFASQCRAWIGGENVDWHIVLPAGARRIGLPLTPFERRRCWISTRHDPAFNVPSTIHEVCSINDPLIADHIVEGETIAAGALLISEAVRKLGLKFPFAVTDVSWRRTVKVSSEGLLVDLRRKGNHVSILFGDEDAVASFAISNVVAVANKETIPITIHTINSSEFYTMLATAGVVYGPSFARIKSLSTNTGVAVCDLSQPADASRGLLDARILDAALQACAGVIEKDGSGLRPASIGKLTVWRALSYAVRAVVRRRGADDPLTVDIFLLDTEGETVATLDKLVLLPTVSIADYDGPPLRLLRPTRVQISALPISNRSGSVIIVDPYYSRDLTDALVAILQADDNVVYLTDVLTEQIPENLVEIVYLGGVGGKGTDGVLALMRLCKTLAANRLVMNRLLLRVVAEETPSGAAVTAFAKALSRELEWLQLCLICLPVGSQPKQGAAWINVTPDAPQDAEIIVHDGVYSRLVLNEIQSTVAGNSIVANGRYLIAGGSGGIGRALGRYLAETQGATVWLIGRRPLNVDEQASIAELARGKIFYLQADITDVLALRLALSDIRAVGSLDAIIHAALVMEDKLILDQSEVEVERVLAPKTRGIDALMAAVDGIEVHSWIAFSSSNAYTANQGQAAYAAASAYLDLSVLATGKNARVIDWGLWGDIGRMAGDPRTAGLKRMGVWPITTAEGFAAFESILAGKDQRVLAMKIVDTLLPALGVEVRSSITPVTEAIEEMIRNEPPLATFDSTRLQAVDAYAIAYLAEYLDSVPSIMPIPEMQRLAKAIETLRMEANGSAEEMKLLVEAAGKETAPYVALLDHTLPNLREVLEGRITAASILFPDGSDHLVAPIYKGNPMIDWLQRLAARAVAAAVQDKLIRQPNRPIRILEIGGGTGGTTGFVLDEIAPFTNQDVSYIFTDIGPSFLVAARRQFVDIPNFEVKLLDISRVVAAQGFDNGSVDVVLAANVVHATPCISETLNNIAQLLTDDGVLVLKEATGIHAINTLTFGLTAEWWGYSDPQSRMSGGPLLSRAGWRLALTKAGYSNVSIAGLPGDDDGLGAESVIVSVASNFVRAPIKAVSQEVAPSSNLSQVKPIGVHSSIEKKLIASVAEALHLEPNEIDLSASFADYGADSIISVELVRKINESFGIELKTTALFNFATVRDLARYITLEFGDQSLQQAVLEDKDEVIAKVDESRSRTNRLREMIDKRRTAIPLNAEADFLAREAQNLAVNSNQKKFSAMSMENLLKSLETGEIDLKQAYQVDINQDA